jgi:hypothetical protein
MPAYQPVPAPLVGLIPGLAVVVAWPLVTTSVARCSSSSWSLKKCRRLKANQVLCSVPASWRKESSIHPMPRAVGGGGLLVTAWPSNLTASPTSERNLPSASDLPSFFQCSDEGPWTSPCFFRADQDKSRDTFRLVKPLDPREARKRDFNHRISYINWSKYQPHPDTS